MSGPSWQYIVPGDWVRAANIRAESRRVGEVVAVTDEAADGTPRHVLVLWGTSDQHALDLYDRGEAEIRPTDCLELVVAGASEIFRDDYYGLDSDEECHQ